MLKKIIQFFTGNKSAKLVKLNASVLNVFENTRKSLLANNEKMNAHYTQLQAEIESRQLQQTSLSETVATNNNVIANLNKIFTTQPE